MNTEQKLLEIQRLLSEVVGEFEVRTLRVSNIDKPFSRTLDDNARSIRELHRGLYTSGQLDTWITNLRRADKLTNENDQQQNLFAYNQG